MDIWLSRCNKTVRCYYCLEDIVVGEPAVFGKLWQRKIVDGVKHLKWTVNIRWHGKRLRDGQCCWLEQGLEKLATAVHVEHRGRKRILMSIEHRKSRLFILKKRARLVQKLKALAEAGTDKWDIDRVIEIGSQLEKLQEEIEPFGGVPRSWLPVGSQSTT